MQHLPVSFLTCKCRTFIRELCKNVRPPQLRRTMATAMRQRKKPSRMMLSRDVAKSPDGRNGGRTTRIGSGPFAGMNQRVANIKGQAQQSLPKTRDSTPLFHALKMQQTLAPMSYNQRNSVKQRLDQITSFEQFHLRTDVKGAIYTQALPGLSSFTPTPAQKLAIPALLKTPDAEQTKKKAGEVQYDQFLIAAETGSGKTLAYLLPVIDAVKRQEVADKVEEQRRSEKEAKEKEARQKENIFEVDPPQLSESPHSTTGRPRALILLPSSELVQQVGKVVKVMSHTIKYRSAPISSASSATVIRNRLFNPNGIDVVISTPHLISSIAQKEPNILSRVQYLVVDEADSLLDRSFSSITCEIIDRAAPSLKQLILCSATIPNSLERFLDKRYPDIKRLVTPKLHTIPRRVQLGVLDIEKEPYRSNRDLACADAIWKIGRTQHDDDHLRHTVKNIIVFVNERETAESVAKYLESKGIDVVALTRDTSEQRQNEVLDQFTSANRIEGDEKQPSNSSKHSRDFLPFADSFSAAPDSSPFGAAGKIMKRLTNTKVLVTTDLGSRGIDTLAVRNIVLYDVPHSTIDFVHRLGRLGRMGRRGRAVVLVGRKDRRDVVREVQDAMFRGQALI